MKKNDVVIKVNTKNREVYFNDNFAGVNAENLQSNLVFEFDGEFVNGTPRVEVEKDGEKYIITDVSKVEDTYVMEIKSSLLTTDVIWLQLVITEVGEEEIPIFKSRKFYLVVKESINADTELPDEYATLYDQIEEKIAEANNLNIDANKVDNVSTVTITDRYGTDKTVNIYDGEKGQDGKDAKINGYNTITIEAGTNIDLEQEGETLTINNIYDDSSVGSSIDVSINTTTYVMTTNLKNSDGTVISTSSIDLPLESVVVSGTYDSVHKKIILTLQNGNTIDIPVGDLVSGLQTEITSDNKLSSDLVDDTNQTNKFVTAEDKTNWNNKVSQNDFEASQELQDKEIDKAKLTINAIADTSDTDTDITLNNTAECPMEIELGANTYQYSTTGKNLYNVFDEITSKTRYTTVDNKGWITMEYDNTSGSNPIYPYYSTNNLDLQTSTQYAIIVEVKEKSGTFTNYFATNYYASQSSDNVTGNISLQNINKYIFTTKSSFDSVSEGLRTVMEVLPGNTAKLVYRMSVLADTTVTTDNFVYEPYTNGASPNPDYPQDIQVVTGNNTVLIRNRNLFDGEIELGNIDINTGELEDNTTRTRSKNFIKVKPNTTYTFTRNVGGIKWILGYKKDKTVISDGIVNSTYSTVLGAIGVGYNTTTFTTTSTTEYLKWYDTSCTDINEKIQLEIGSTATDYVEHKEQTYPITLGDIEYCKIGSYEDRIFKNIVGDIDYSSDRELGKWYIKKNIGKVVLDGSSDENWLSGGLSFYIDISNKKEESVALSTHFIHSNTWTSSSEQYRGKFTAQTPTGEAHRLKFMPTDENITTTELFKNWLNTHNTIAYYQLETPTYTLLNNTLQTELNNIEETISYEEQTNISQINDELSFIITAMAKIKINVPTKTSELENDSGYVKNTDYANETTAGVIKTSAGTYGTAMTNGVLRGTTKAYDTQYPYMNNDGFISKGTLENVITGKSLVSNTNYASSSTGGVIKTDTSFGTGTSNNGNIFAQSINYDNYNNFSQYGFIGKGTLENVIEGKGLTNVAHTNANNNFSTAQTITGTLTVNGDIVQSGSSYETHAEQLYTKKDLIKTRDGAVGGLGNNEVTGIEALLYDGTNNGRLVFDNTGTAKVGDVGDEVPLLARDESSNLINGQVLVWDATNLIAVGSSSYVKNTDYATQNTGGVAKMWTSTNEDNEIGLNISTQ